MIAVRIHTYGDESVLAYEETPEPTLLPNDVLVRVVATSVNPVDWKIREGHLQQMLPYSLPLTLGWDVSGIIEAVGANVTRFKAGDAVYSRPDIKRNGTYAEYIAINEEEIAYKPKTLSHIEAATLPLVSITAWEALFTTAKLTPNHRVLIHAGSGGVGSIAVQLAKVKGAYVIATTSTKNKSLVESLGADEVINYERQDFSQAVRGVDVVFDTLGGDIQNASWSVLNPGGILVSIVSPPDQTKAKTKDARGAFVFIEPSAKILDEMATLIDSGKVRPIVGAEFGLKDMQKAHALSQTGHSIGKIAIYVAMP